ncbi:hypothetical protein LR48_Vigan1086s001300 [Vigna angularis]|uniref:Uncharacterized protein n=1 Tax=Phaseolus angularis TaxID=3914 RepID=A0A0L9TI37_PHAAN|nr:hypothetical protein LR48_Vigan1086s001300 [Vigna angularis]
MDAKCQATRIQKSDSGRQVSADEWTLVLTHRRSTSSVKSFSLNRSVSSYELFEELLSVRVEGFVVRRTVLLSLGRSFTLREGDELLEEALEEENLVEKPAAKNGSVTASAKKGNPAAAASSSDLSEESSDEDDVPKTKAVPAAAKNITSSSKKTQPSGSSDSDSDSSSDEDDKKKISATTKLPASSDDDSSEDSDEDDDVKPSATAVSKPAVSKKKVDSFDSNDSNILIYFLFKLFLQMSTIFLILEMHVCTVHII